MWRILFMLFVSFLAGCSTLGGNTVAVATGEGDKREVSIDPINFVGVQWTDAVREGNYQAYLVNFPKGLFAEFHPLRVRYNAVAYGEKTGKEYPAQALYSGYAECALRMTLIVEGSPDEPVTGAIATTRLTRLYSLYGDPISSETPEKFASDAAYRKEAVLSGGTSVKRMKSVPVSGKSGLRSVFNEWTAFRINGSSLEIRSPLPQKAIVAVSRENPELSFSEKLVGNGRFALSPSWFSIAMGAAQDIITAAGASDKGWDEQSELKREYQGMIAQVVAAQYQAAINAGMSCGPRQQRVKY